MAELANLTPFYATETGFLGEIVDRKLEIYTETRFLG
jgi:hypothetical protein